MPIKDPVRAIGQISSVPLMCIQFGMEFKI